MRKLSGWRNVLEQKTQVASASGISFRASSWKMPLHSSPQNNASTASLPSATHSNETSAHHKTPLGDAATQLPGSAHSGPSIGRRFYKSAYAKAADDGDGYVVMLDHRILKTPSKKPLRVPSFSLAHAVAAEWEYQDLDGIRPFTMPLMKLASTAIDRVPQERQKIVKQLLHFFHTDSVCCRDKDDTPLGELQAEVLNPLLDWIEREVGCRPSQSSSIFVGDQPDEVVAAMEKALKSVSDWQLAAVDSLSAAAKSLVIAMAVSRGRLNIEEAVQVIRLEEDYQIEEWGLVEGGHDIDMADLRSRVAAASVFLRLL